MEGDDRDIYVCVKQKWNKKKWNIYAVLSNVYCFLFFYFLPFHLDFYISLILAQVGNEFLKL